MKDTKKRLKASELLAQAGSDLESSASHDREMGVFHLKVGSVLEGKWEPLFKSRSVKFHNFGLITS